MDQSFKPLLGEFLGTFTLVFIGAGAGALAGTTGAGLLGVALAHAMALTILVYTWGKISGAHVNPAISFAAALGGWMPWPRAVGYWVAQFAGGIVAAFLLAWLLAGLPDSQALGLGETIGVLTQTDPARTIVLEAVLTFLLAAAVIVSGIAGSNGNAYGLAIGFVLAAEILMGGHLTGASMNPARTLGPAIAQVNVGYVWMYFVGPLVGAGIAGLLLSRVFELGKK